MLAQLLEAAAHVLEPAADRAARSGRPTLQKHAERAPQGQVVLTREPGQLEGVRRGARGAATHQFEQGRVDFSHAERAGMGQVRDPCLHALDKRSRAIDLAERPQRKRQIEHGRDAGVSPEAKGQIVVAAGLERGERVFQMIPRVAILAGEPASHSGGAMRDAGFGRIGPRLDIAKDGRGVSLHRREIAPHVAADP